MPVRIALMVDDGAPVNTACFYDPPYKHPLLIPNSLPRDFADLCAEYGVRGKFSVIPMPCCLGGIDGTLNHVPQRHLAGFLKIVREKIAPRFDITPEILTHLAAYRMAGGFHHLYEDEWIARATVDEMTEYIALALKILDHVGLPANGVTSPWSAGDNDELAYAQAISAAQWRVNRLKVTWYFLCLLGQGPARGPRVTWHDITTAQWVVSIPATTSDPFWDTQRPMANSSRAARQAAMAGIDLLLAADGRSGRIPEVIGQNCPVVILTHWQALFSEGSCAGLWGLKRLLNRLHNQYGGDLAWTTCSELAAQTVAQAAEGRRAIG